MLKTLKDYCNIIQISYELKVWAHVEGFHMNINMTFPITIGSVPIRDGVLAIVPPISDDFSDDFSDSNALPDNNNFSTASAPYEDDLRKYLSSTESLCIKKSLFRSSIV